MRQINSVPSVSIHGKRLGKKEYILMHQNVQYIGNGFNQLEVLIKSLGASFVTITERWKSRDELFVYQLPDYVLVSEFYRESGKHGGCAIYCRGEMKCKARTAS
ncbi:hypothetical protein WA026_006541 [Henosepilachna vigintioctopunctata]|uniref:Uncharacterized protein n=1 Tax=Henosepilachna vigintioctopunctata TaxID=420089 RepID=A0AAW1UFZ9_9CUCU